MNYKKSTIDTLLVIFLTLLVFQMSGCLSPSERRQKLKDKVEETEVEIDDKKFESVIHGVGNTLAAQHALGLDPDPSIHTSVAKDRLIPARSAFELSDAIPGPAEVQGLTRAASLAVSTNEVERSEAKLIFEAYDKRLAIKAKQLEQYEAALVSKEANLEKADRKNASMADSWAKLLAFRNWIIFIIVFFVLARIGIAVFGMTSGMSPVIAAGGTAIRAGGKFFASAFRDVYRGGSRFLEKVDAQDWDDDHKKAILGLFKESQSNEQDRTTKEMVAQLKKKSANGTKQKPVHIIPA
jgi:hypothetical protein